MTSGFRVAGPRRLGLWLLSAVAAGLLAGCVEMRNAAETRAARALLGTGPQATQGAFALAPNGTATLTDPEMEPDPGAFSVAETVAWDGERTLQGVWIAHPQADSARRVRIVNMQTGAAVDGALFKREAGLPGPEVLVSSDAAVALGLAPEVPVPLEITAIRFAPPEPALAAAETVAADAAGAPPGTAAPNDAGAAEGVAAETDAGAADGVAATEDAVQPTAAVTERSGPEPASGAASATREADRAPPGEKAAETAPEAERMHTANLVTPEMQAGLSRNSVRRRPAAAAEAAGSPPEPDPAERPAATGEAQEPSASEAPAAAAATARDRAPEAPARAASEAEAGEPVAAGMSEETAAAPRSVAGPATEVPAQGTGGMERAAQIPTDRDQGPQERAPAPARDADPRATQAETGAGAGVPPASSAGPGPASAAAATAPGDGSEAASAAAGKAPGRTTPAPPPPERESAEAGDASRVALAATRDAAGAGEAAPRPARPFVQAGIFAVTENAERLVARFRAAGFPAEGKPMTYRGAPAIRVVAGPFETEAALADALRTLRRIGPSDAVPVRK